MISAMTEKTMAETDKDLAAYDISGLKLGKGDAVRPVGLHDLTTYTPSGFPAPPATFGTLENCRRSPGAWTGTTRWVTARSPERIM